jgi:hypothetical protein
LDVGRIALIHVEQRIGKVTSLLLLPITGAHDHRALLGVVERSVSPDQSSKLRAELMVIRESYSLRGAPCE